MGLTEPTTPNLGNFLRRHALPPEMAPLELDGLAREAGEDRGPLIRQTAEVAIPREQFGQIVGRTWRFPGPG